MSDRDDLYELWAIHGSCIESDSGEGYELADAIIAAGWRPPLIPGAEKPDATEDESRIEKAILWANAYRGPFDFAALAVAFEAGYAAAKDGY